MRGAVMDLAAADFCGCGAAAEAAAIAALAALLIGRECRTMGFFLPAQAITRAARSIPRSTAAPLGHRDTADDKRNTEDEPRGVRAAAARRRTGGVVVVSLRVIDVLSLVGPLPADTQERVQLLCHAGAVRASCSRSQRHALALARCVRRTTSLYNAIRFGR
jgi:hypothetical protein